MERPEGKVDSEEGAVNLIITADAVGIVDGVLASTEVEKNLNDARAIAEGLKLAIEECDYAKFKELFYGEVDGKLNRPSAELKAIVVEFKKLTLKPISEWKQHPDYFGISSVKPDGSIVVVSSEEYWIANHNHNLGVTPRTLYMPANIFYISMYKQEPEVFEALHHLGLKFTLEHTGPGEHLVYASQRKVFINPLGYMVLHASFFGRYKRFNREDGFDSNIVMNCFMRFFKICLANAKLEDFTALINNQKDLGTILDLFRESFLARLKAAGIDGNVILDELRETFYRLQSPADLDYAGFEGIRADDVRCAVLDASGCEYIRFFATGDVSSTLAPEESRELLQRAVAKIQVKAT